MPEIVILISIMILPFVMMCIYFCIMTSISFKKNLVLLITSIFLVGTYSVMLVLEHCIADGSTLIEQFAFVTALYVFMFIGMFEVLEDAFTKAYYPERKPNININKDCSDVVEYHKYPKKVIIIGYIYRSIIFAVYTSMFAVVAVRMYLQAGMLDQVVLIFTCIFAGIGVIFFSCRAFVRLLVRCPNCDSTVFYIDPNLEAFFSVAKRVVKERVLDCKFCQATYALDPSIDLEEIKKKKKETIAKAKAMVPDQKM